LKTDLILLHGALGSRDQFAELKKLLETNFNIFTFNFEGHGGKHSSNEFSTQLFAENLLKFIGENNLKGCDIFGYSMGGYVALELAFKHHGLIKKIITLGTKFKWDKASAEQEAKMMNPEIIEKKIPHFAATLKERHKPEDWKVIMSKTAQLMLNMANGNAMDFSDFEKINNDVLIMIGDQDKMVTREESEKVSRLLPNGKYLILENTPHPIEMVDSVKLSDVLRNFFLRKI